MIKVINYFKASSIVVKIALTLFIIELIFFSQFKVIIGSGMSMDPTIKDKSVLLCDYTNNYHLNDIVYYKVGHKHIVHRIIKITEYKLTDNTIVKKYQTKGDNNPEEDAFEIYDENIICKVLFK